MAQQTQIANVNQAKVKEATKYHYLLYHVGLDLDELKYTYKTHFDKKHKVFLLQNKLII